MNKLAQLLTMLLTFFLLLFLQISCDDCGRWFHMGCVNNPSTCDGAVQVSDTRNFDYATLGNFTQGNMNDT